MTSEEASLRALELGKAAEHIVCADLILSGYVAFLSDQGLPYDVLMERESRLLRIQVKATLSARNVNAKGAAIQLKYSWAVRRRGKKGSSRLNDESCDIVALVALDTREVAYLPIQIVGQTVQITPTSFNGSIGVGRFGWARRMNQWPIEDALKGPTSYEKVVGVSQKNFCKYGHEYEKVGGRRKYGCPQCNRDRSALKRLQRKQDNDF